VHVVPFPKLYITGIRDPGSLARRSAMMSSRLVLEDWLGSTRIHRELGLPVEVRVVVADEVVVEVSLE